jgi:hypothetical protein
MTHDHIHHLGFAGRSPTAAINLQRRSCLCLEQHLSRGFVADRYGSDVEVAVVVRVGRCGAGVGVRCAGRAVRGELSHDQVHRGGDSEPCRRGRGLQDRPQRRGAQAHREGTRRMAVD